MRIRLRQNIPIQPVASDCFSVTPLGSFSLRSIIVMLSSPRKPPSKRLFPSLSILFTHQAKLIRSLWKQRSRNRRSAFPERIRSMLYTRHTAQACTGGFKSENSHSYAGIWPLGCWNCSKRRSQSCSLANSASTKARATQWKARSQAANQGYSHLSGIDRTRIELRCCQRLFRMERRDSGGGQFGLSPSSQADTSNKYICLLHSMPAKAWRCTHFSSSVAVGGCSAA